MSPHCPLLVAAGPPFLYDEDDNDDDDDDDEEEEEDVDVDDVDDNLGEAGVSTKISTGSSMMLFTT